MSQKNKLLMVSLAALALVGCGKKIPECGSSNVLGLVKGLQSKQYAEGIEIASRDLAKEFSGQMNNIFSVSPAKPKIEITGLKIDGIASQGINKETGMNTCNAIPSGQVNFEFSYDLTINKGGELAAAALELSGLKTEMFPKIMEKMLTESSPEMHITASGINLIDEKKFKSRITMKGTVPIPQALSYTAQFNDKGDQLLVNVQAQQ